jgi:hypothetical protein
MQKVDMGYGLVGLKQNRLLLERDILEVWPQTRDIRGSHDGQKLIAGHGIPPQTPGGNQLGHWPRCVGSLSNRRGQWKMFDLILCDE